MKLFGHPDSGHAYKVKLLLDTQAIAHDYEIVDIWAPREARSDEFKSTAKFSEVPALIDEGEAYVQSNAILIYLANKHQRFGGESASRLQQCTEWLVWEANKIGMCLPQLRTIAKFETSAELLSAQAWLEARFIHDVGVIKQNLSDGRSWMLPGSSPTIADFSLCGYLFFMDEVPLAVPDEVSDWLGRLASLPGWQHPYQLLGDDQDNA